MESAKKSKKWFIIGGIAIIVVIIGIIFGIYINMANQYEEAQMSLKLSRYDDAIEQFTALGNYKDSKQMVVEVHYQKACSKLNENLDEAFQIFDSIPNYHKVTDELPNLLYDKGTSLFESGKFDDAVLVFERIPEYGNSSKYLSAIDTLKGLQGTWQTKEEEGGSSQYIINGTKVYWAFYYEGEIVGDARLDCTLDIFPNLPDGYVGELNILDEPIIYYIENDKLIVKFYDSDSVIRTLEKVSDSTTVPKEKKEIKSDPRIGMTADEVRKSSWGRPQKINKTTTKYGVREQWVYSDGYIYLDDGIVTAIQE